MTCGIVHRLRRLQKEVMALLYDVVLFPDTKDRSRCGGIFLQFQEVGGGVQGHCLVHSEFL